MLQKVVDAILNLFRNHKKKIVVMLVAFVVFAVARFPYGDLGDLVTAKVMEITDNQVYLQFDDMGISIFPSPGVKLENVYVESPFLPSLNVQTLALAPSIAGLLTFNPGLSFRASGFLNGNLSVSAKKGKELSDDNFQIDVSSSWSRLAIKDILRLADISIDPKGNIDGDATLVLDPSFKEPPDGKIYLRTKKIEIPADTPTMMGPLPKLTFSQMEINVQLVNNQLKIEQARIGSPQDPVSGEVTGSFGLRMQKNRQGGVEPVFSNYELRLKLSVNESLTERGILALALGFLDRCKKPGRSGKLNYRCRLSASGFQTTPRIQSF